MRLKDVELLMAHIRAQGHVPKDQALRLRMLREYMSEAQQEELGTFTVAPQHAVTEVMDFIRAFKRLPRKHPKPTTASAWEAKLVCDYGPLLG